MLTLGTCHLARVAGASVGSHSRRGRSRGSGCSSTGPLACVVKGRGHVVTLVTCHLVRVTGVSVVNPRGSHSRREGGEVLWVQLQQHGSTSLGG